MHDAASPPPLHPPPEPFRAAWWLPGAHTQTVVGKYLRPRVHLRLSEEEWETPDGDRLELVVGDDPGGSAPVVLVLHGLEGNVHRAYVRLTLDHLAREGALPVALNFRGCGREPNLRPRFYHSGETTDIDFVLTRLGERFSGRPVGAVGYSLGGNMLLRLLGEGGNRVAQRVSAAAAVSVPYDLAGGTRILSQGLMGRVYSHYFLRSLREKVASKRGLLEGHLDVERALAAPSIRDFDEHATAPLHGFAGADDYYERARVEPVLDAIRVPTLLLQARNDPFLPAGSIPEGAIRRNPWLVASIAPSGGHLGFVSGPHPLRPRFWAEESAARWVVGQLRGGSGG